MTNYIKSNELDNYEIQHYDIMNACVSTVANLALVAANDKKYQEWLQVFHDNQNYLFVGLCDEELCEMASQLLVKFFKLLKEDALKSMPLLVRSLEVVFGNNGARKASNQQYSRRCQEVFSAFLIALYDYGHPFSESLTRLRASLLDQRMDLTPLAVFLNHTARS